MMLLSMNAATAAAIAKAGVKTASGESIMHGIWVLVFLVSGGLIAGWRIWLKNAPERLTAKTAAEKTKSDSEETMRTEMWAEIAALKLRDEDKGRRLTMAETRIAGQTVRLGQQGFVITMLLDEIERISPGNTIARSARALINMQADQMPHAEEIAPMADIMSKLCVVDREEGKPQ